MILIVNIIVELQHIRAIPHADYKKKELRRRWWGGGASPFRV